MKVYLDWAATTPLKKEVLEAMKPYLGGGFGLPHEALAKWGNASSVHSFGREAREGVDEAREKVAQFLNCSPLEIVFTSGGTEANNLAIKGVIFSNDSTSLTINKAISQQKRESPHIITSQIEHHSVLDTCKWLEKMGFAEVTYLSVDKKGIVRVEDVKKAIKKNTALITIMYVNNEIGTIQPIREIGKLIEKINRGFRSSVLRSLSSVFCPILFHTDAVQAPEYLNLDVKHLHVDMLTLSAHKFGGPKGVGVLHIKKGVNLESQNRGGNQEWGMRAGTENVAGIVGGGAAISNLKTKNEKRQLKVKKLRDKLIEGILKTIPATIFNGDRENGAPHIANFCFKGIKTDVLLTALDMEGIAVSSGSACVSGSVEPSHVTSALKIPQNYGCVRFSLGDQTTQEEIDYVLKVLPKIIKRLRNGLPSHS